MADLNAYKKKAAERKSAQKALEDGVNSQDIEATTQEPKKQQKKKPTICVSISEEDRERLQQYARENGATVSGLIHKWIIENIYK